MPTVGLIVLSASYKCINFMKIKIVQEFKAGDKIIYMYWTTINVNSKRYISLLLYWTAGSIPHEKSCPSCDMSLLLSLIHI